MDKTPLFTARSIALDFAEVHLPDLHATLLARGAIDAANVFKATAVLSVKSLAKVPRPTPRLHSVSGRGSRLARSGARTQGGTYIHI